MNKVEITENYFNQVLFVSQTLQRFKTDIESSISIEALESTELYDVLLPYKEIMSPLITAILIDIVNGYLFMGHSLDINKCEGLGLVLANYSLLEPDCDYVEYSNWNDNKGLKDHAKNTFSFIEKLDERKYWYEKKDFLLANTLKSIDSIMAERYVLRLYRFFEIIATIDGTVTTEEENTIRNLLPDISKYIIN